MPDFFKHRESAMIFSPQYPEEGAEMIKEVLGNKELADKLGKNAREIAEQYTLDRFVNSWNDILENI
jgi:glycosyltransferase involved in cell wall biosynthesis